MADRYTWIGLQKDVGNWVRTCIECQRTKVHQYTKTPVGTFKCPDQHFATVHMNIVAPLAHCQGYSNVLTIIDRFTRWPEAIPIADATAITCVRALPTHWVARFGIPEDIISDQRRQFTANLCTELCNLLGTQHHRTTVFHPQCNGMIERFHRQMKAALRAC